MALSQFLLRNTDLNDFTFCGQNNLMFSIITTFSQHISIIYQVTRVLHFETCFYLKMKIVQCVMLMRVLSQHLKHCIEWNKFAIFNSEEQRKIQLKTIFDLTKLINVVEICDWSWTPSMDWSTNNSFKKSDNIYSTYV